MPFPLPQIPKTKFFLVFAQLVSVMVSLVLASTVMAQLQVSGSITSSQRWQVSDSPVQVSGDVLIENGAILSIDPGVKVELGVNASIIVRSGGLYAVGTPSSKIVFTSSKVPAQAQPGDWGQLRFEAGTLDASTALDHAVVEYGDGIALQAASPTLRNLVIRHHAGAAIAMDTASSPIGEGLSATGNGLDGIQVAAGVISGDAVWGLRGIPYVVPSGTIEIGAPGFSLTPQRVRLVQGVNASLRLSLPSAAPVGGVVVSMASSVPSSVGVPPSVTFAEGESEKLVNLNALSPGLAVLTASRPGFEAATADVEVVAPPSLGLATNVVVSIGETEPVSLTLSERAPDAGLTVDLLNSNPDALSAPASVQVPGRARSVNVEVRGLTSGTARLQATSPGWQSAATDVVSRGRSLVLPTPLVVAPGASWNVTISVTETVASQPLSIALTASAPGMVEVPTSVEIPVGASSTSFVLRGLAQGTLQLSASAAGYETASADVVVEAIELAWIAPFIYDSTPSGMAMYLPAQFPTSARLRLSRPAPIGGLRVRLRAANPSMVQFDSPEVVIPEGSDWVEAYIRMTGVSQGITQVIAESDGTTSAVHDVRVGPPVTLRWMNGGTSLSLGRGMAGRPPIELRSDGRYVALLEPVTVSVLSSDAQKVSTQSSVTLSAIGSGSAGPTVTGREATASPVQLQARLGEAGPEASIDVQVVEPQLSFGGLQGLRAVGGARDDFWVGVSVTAPDAIYQWVADPLIAQVSVIDASPADVVDGIHSQPAIAALVSQIDLGAGGSLSDTAYVGTPIAEGNYRIRAVVPGMGAVDSDLQQAASPSLRFSRESVTVAAGMRTLPYRIGIQRRVGSQGAASSTPVTIRLENPDPASVSVPEEVVIPAYQDWAYFEVEGRAVSSADVLVRAVAEGHQSIDPIRIRVVAPSLRLIGLDGQRNLNADRDMFSVHVGADAPDAIDAALTTSQSIALSLLDATPGDVVGGFFSNSSGGAPLSSVTLPANMSAVWLYVGEGQKSGSYRVRAEASGMETATSDLQRVSGTELVFSHSAVRVGRGLEVQYHLYIERRQNGILVNAPSALTVNLATARPDAIGLPATVTINAFSSRVQVPIRGLSVVEAVQITAEAEGMGAAANTSVSVSVPTVVISELDGFRSLASAPDYFRVYVSGDGAGWVGYQTAIDDIQVDLTIIDQDPAAVVPGLFEDPEQSTPRTSVIIPAGSMYSDNGVYIGSPTSLGRYRIRAFGRGLTEGISDEQVVMSVGIAFEQSGKNLGIKFQGDLYFRFQLPGGGTSYNEEDVLVSFECLDETICEAPASVLVPASCGECSSGAWVTIRGLAEGTTRLRASAPGYTDALLTINVVKSEIAFINLPESIAEGDSPPVFGVELLVPAHPSTESDYDYDQSPFEVIEVDVVSSHPGILGIETPEVSGKLRVGTGQFEEAVIVLPTPRVPGMATITASGSGLDPVSQDVTVE